MAFQKIFENGTEILDGLKGTLKSGLPEGAAKILEDFHSEMFTAVRSGSKQSIDDFITTVAKKAEDAGDVAARDFLTQTTFKNMLKGIQSNETFKIAFTDALNSSKVLSQDDIKALARTSGLSENSKLVENAGHMLDEREVLIQAKAEQLAEAAGKDKSKAAEFIGDARKAWGNLNTAQVSNFVIPENKPTFLHNILKYGHWTAAWKKTFGDVENVPYKSVHNFNAEYTYVRPMVQAVDKAAVNSGMAHAVLDMQKRLLVLSEKLRTGNGMDANGFVSAVRKELDDFRKSPANVKAVQAYVESLQPLKAELKAKLSGVAPDGSPLPDNLKPMAYEWGETSGLTTGQLQTLQNYIADVEKTAKDLIDPTGKLSKEYADKVKALVDSGMTNENISTHTNMFLVGSPRENMVVIGGRLSRIGSETILRDTKMLPFKPTERAWDQELRSLEKSIATESYSSYDRIQPLSSADKTKGNRERTLITNLHDYAEQLAKTGETKWDVTASDKWFQRLETAYNEGYGHNAIELMLRLRDKEGVAGATHETYPRSINKNLDAIIAANKDPHKVEWAKKIRAIMDMDHQDPSPYGPRDTAQTYTSRVTEFEFQRTLAGSTKSVPFLNFSSSVRIPFTSVNIPFPGLTTLPVSKPIWYEYWKAPLHNYVVGFSKDSHVPLPSRAMRAFLTGGKLGDVDLKNEVTGLRSIERSQLGGFWFYKPTLAEGETLTNRQRFLSFGENSIWRRMPSNIQMPGRILSGGILFNPMATHITTAGLTTETGRKAWKWGAIGATGITGVSYGLESSTEYAANKAGEAGWTGTESFLRGFDGKGGWGIGYNAFSPLARGAVGAADFVLDDWAGATSWAWSKATGQDIDLSLDVGGMYDKYAVPSLSDLGTMAHTAVSTSVLGTPEDKVSKPEPDEKPAGGATTTPPAGGATTAPPAGGATTTPPAGGATTAPPAGGATTTPPAGGATTTPPAGGATTAPPAGGATTTPPAGGATTTPPNKPAGGAHGSGQPAPPPLTPEERELKEAKESIDLAASSAKKNVDNIQSTYLNNMDKYLDAIRKAQREMVDSGKDASTLDPLHEHVLQMRNEMAAQLQTMKEAQQKAEEIKALADKKGVADLAEVKELAKTAKPYHIQTRDIGKDIMKKYHESLQEVEKYPDARKYINPNSSDFFGKAFGKNGLGGENGLLGRITQDNENGGPSVLSGAFNSVANWGKGVHSWWTQDVKRSVAGDKSAENWYMAANVGLGIVGAFAAINLINNVVPGVEISGGMKWLIVAAAAAYFLHKTGETGNDFNELAGKASDYSGNAYGGAQVTASVQGSASNLPVSAPLSQPLAMAANSTATTQDAAIVTKTGEQIKTVIVDASGNYHGITHSGEMKVWDQINNASNTKRTIDAVVSGACANLPNGTGEVFEQARRVDNGSGTSDEVMIRFSCEAPKTPTAVVRV